MGWLMIAWLLLLTLGFSLDSNRVIARCSLRSESFEFAQRIDFCNDYRERVLDPIVRGHRFLKPYDRARLRAEIRAWLRWKERLLDEQAAWLFRRRRGS